MVEFAIIDIDFIVVSVGGIDQVSRGPAGNGQSVYEAPNSELFTAMIAWLGFNCGAHPLIVPSSVANRKIAGQPCTLNSDDRLKTIPVDRT
jgi:hypothetical protein